ncbi:NACHT domain-containing protein [Streptomyces sioyaensis]|uniref:NACHT domain-containing protein n=1 Tax=Streptomyces sioyaensis TaxID=67364 RepID=UPI003797CF60
MKRRSPATVALGAMVPVVRVLLLAGGVVVAGNALVPARYAPWGRAVVLALAVVLVVREVRRRRTGGAPAGRPVLREGGTRNELSGITYGHALMADVIKQVTFNDVRMPPTFKGTLDDAADRLAESVRKQWRDEEEQRKVQDPIPLPVRWQPASDALMDHWSNICAARPGALPVPGPLPLAGQLHEIVDVYRRIPSGRLVVLGRAGSGKSILTIRFVLDLLKARTASTEPVPVIFSLASWDPAMPLRRWMTGQLERDYPGLAVMSPGPGASTLAAELVERDRILPVLDGFDEIADGLHRRALEKLNGHAAMHLLLTSRRDEYATAVQHTKALTAAAVVELTDLSPADLDAYLPRTARKATATSTVWEPVLRSLREHPQDPAGAALAAVLTTPLMVALARILYSDTPDRTPSELLDSGLGTREALEDHLLDNFVPTLYQDQSPARRARVLHWLGYLAQHLDRLGTRDLARHVDGPGTRDLDRHPDRPGTRDLAWWQLGDSLSLSSRRCVIGLVAGLAFGLVDGLVMWGVTWFALGFGPVMGLMNGLVNGFSFASMSALAFGIVYGYRYGEAACEPSRVRVRLLGGAHAMRKEFAPRMAIGLAGGFGMGALTWLVAALEFALVVAVRESPGSAVTAFLATRFDQGFNAALLYGLSAGLAYALMAGLEAPIDIETVVSPPDLLHTNRTTALFQLLVLALVLGGMGGVLYWTGWFSIASWVAFGLVGGLGGGLAYALSMTAWGQWVALSRIWLPLTGRLPWNVSAFLADAHRRGVLRQAGAVYQFRHVRLQHHLTRAFRTTPQGGADRVRAERAV